MRLLGGSTAAVASKGPFLAVTVIDVAGRRRRGETRD
jgi:hypothetical protein